MSNETGTLTQSILNRASSVASKNAASTIHKALHQAGSKTGVSFEFLLNTAKRESSLNPEAKARTSSATGLFQFIDQTWLAAIYKHGETHGLKNEAHKIEQDKNGHFKVTNPKDRDAILNLRLDPEKASALAAELTADNQRYLEKKLSRPVSNAELYAAHFLGAGGAVKLLSAGPNTKAADILPAAAKANKGIFYALNGPKTVRAVIASFEKTFAPPIAQTSLETSANAPASSSPTLLPQSLFAGLTQSALDINKSNPNHTSHSLPIENESHKLNPKAPIIKQSNSISSVLTHPINTLPKHTPLKALQSYGGLNAISPLAISVLQSLDPTLLSRKNKD